MTTARAWSARAVDPDTGADVIPTETIGGLTPGVPRTLERVVTYVATDDPLASVQFVVSDALTDGAARLLTKTITTTASAAGQITDDGATTGTAALTLTLSAEDTLALGAGRVYAAAVATLASGTVVLLAQATLLLTATAYSAPETLGGGVAVASTGIAVVADDAARDARYPTPATHTRVQNLDSGWLERYDGTAWVREAPIGRGAAGVYLVTAYGADATGATGVSTAFAAALTAAATTGAEVVVPPGTYYVDADLTIPEGVTLRGLGWQGDNLLRSGDGDALLGAVLVFRGASITVGANATVDGFTVYYDQQKYALTADAGQPDGLEAFTTYDPTFYVARAGATIRRIVYLGGTHFVQQVAYTGSNTTNPEKLTIEQIRGAPLLEGVRLTRVTDIPRFRDIHFNANSYGSLLTGTTANFYTKIAKHATAFRFGRVDDAMFEACFAFGYRDGIAFEDMSASGSNLDSRDTGEYGGATLVNTSFDGVHTALRLGRRAMQFGVKWSSGFAAPIVQGVVRDGAVSAETSALVRWTAGAERCRVLLTNVTTFGTTNAVLTGSAACTNPYQYAAGVGVGNVALVTGCGHYDYTGAPVAGATSDSYVQFSNTRLITEQPLAEGGASELVIGAAGRTAALWLTLTTDGTVERGLRWRAGATLSGSLWVGSDGNTYWNAAGTLNLRGSTGTSRITSDSTRTRLHGILRVDGNVEVAGTAAATTLGSVTRRLPLYDTAGSLLGYVPIYNTIT